MLMDVPEGYRRTSTPVMLNMFFVEDTDDVTEQCPHDSGRVESTGNGTVSLVAENSTVTISTSSNTTNGSTWMGMAFDFVSEVLVGHTLAFEIPVGTEIFWVSRVEMVQVLQEQELPASLEARVEARLREARLAKGMDGTLETKGSRRRRRRRYREVCSGSQVGAMAGGAASVVAGGLLCAFTFIGCFAGAPFLVGAGTASVTNGACDCWSNKQLTHDSCAIVR